MLVVVSGSCWRGGRVGELTESLWLEDVAMLCVSTLGLGLGLDLVVVVLLLGFSHFM